MNHKKMKTDGANLAIIKKKAPSRKPYSPPRLVCYGDLIELTHNQGSEPPLNDVVWPGTGTGEPH